MSALIGTVHLARLPWHDPPQALKCQPFAGRAVRRSVVYEGTAAPQRRVQETPLELLTEPLPATTRLSRYRAGANSAVALAFAEVLTEQENDPVHDPPHLTNLAPLAGVGVRTRLVSAFHVVVQACEHWRPGTSDTTVPGPLIERAKGTCRSSWTSQGESWMSGQVPLCP